MVSNCPHCGKAVCSCEWPDGSCQCSTRKEMEIREVSKLLEEAGEGRRAKGSRLQRRYANIEIFYSADERRRRSGESDYGCHWRDSVAPYPQYRVSYIQATGEIYAVQLGGKGHVEVLGKVPPDEEDPYYKTLDCILKGWADVCGTKGNLDWVRKCLEEAETAYRGAKR